MPNRGALAGVTVLDLSRLLPGPYCSMILADHGARVIAVEDRRFLGDGLFFTPVNRNKEHMSLNLKTGAGREVLHRLARKADVFIEGFRPGVVERLGVDYPALRALNAGIVYCSITGYGQTGPARRRAGHDVNYLACAGVLELTGEAGRRPCIPGVQIADMAGGGMNAAIGILLALFAREKSGRGQYVDISMTDGMVGLLPLARFFREATGAPLPRGDWMLSHRYACYNTYETADGRHVALGAVENRFWQALCDHLGLSRYGPLQYDETRRLEIIAALRGVFGARTLEEWERELADLDVCCSPVRTVDEVFEDALFREREMVVAVNGPDGTAHTTIGVAAKLSETPGAVRTAPPEFGAGTGAILKELGYGPKAVRRMVETGVV